MNNNERKAEFFAVFVLQCCRDTIPGTTLLDEQIVGLYVSDNQGWEDCTITAEWGAIPDVVAAFTGEVVQWKNA
jgi:hypothetical protein